jgi:DNA-binding NtrC family response regulator
LFSEVGVGTTFNILLPRVEGRQPEKVKPQEKADTRGVETILLVEDEEMLLTLTKKILTRNGYRVLDACSAGDAYLLCEKFKGTIDLLLTDVIMPEMNGRELYEKLHDIQPDLKVLFMSGYSEDIIAPHGVLGDGTPFIQKPFTIDSIARKVREVLDR